jgi:hypothetical protein
MSDASAAQMLESLLDPLSRCLDPESARRVADFRVADEVQERISLLAARANEGRLAADERAEYEAAINAADIIAILRLKALRQLSANGG